MYGIENKNLKGPIIDLFEKLEALQGLFLGTSS